jgi:diguanylate cyclase (GGDEF)-like protein/PAS domain S-box-containing protein
MADFSRINPTLMNVLSPLLVDLSIIVLAVAGVLLLGLKLIQHVWDLSNTSAYPPAALLFTAGVATAVRNRFPWLHRAYHQRPDRKVMLTAAIILLVASSLTALFTALVMADHERHRLTQSMVSDRDALSRGLLMAMEVRGKELERFSHNPLLVQTLQDLQSKPAGSVHPAQLNNLRAMMELLGPHEFTITNLLGDTVLSSEPAVAHHPGLPSLVPSLNFPGEIFLQRDPATLDFYLQMQLPVRDGAQTIGHFIASLPLPASSRFAHELTRRANNTVIKICSLTDLLWSCLPSKIGEMQQIQMLRPDTLPPEARSAQRQSGTALENRNGRRWMISYSPLGASGLGLSLEVPTSQLYAPVVQTLEAGLLFVPGLVLLGLLALGWQLRPLTQELHRANAQLQTAFNYSGIGILLVNGRGELLDFNPAFSEMLGYAPDELRKFSLVDDFLHPEDRGPVAQQLGGIADSTVGAYCAHRRYRHKNGQYRMLRWHVSPVQDEDGTISAIVCYAIDVTDELERKQSMRQQTAFLNAVLDNMQDMVYACDEHGLLSYVNAAAIRAGLPEKSALSLSQLALVSPVHALDHTPVPLNQLPLGAALRGEQKDAEEFLIQNRQGQWRQYQICARRMQDASGAPLGAAAVAHDITDIRAAESRLKWLIEHDELTELPNQTLAIERLEQWLDTLASAEAGGSAMAVFMLDIDRFRQINDSFGHALGDDLLIETAARLKSALPAQDLLARWGGNAFVVLHPGVDDPRQIQADAEFLLSSLAEPFLLDGQIIFIAASLGIVRAPRDGRTATQLFSRADLAMYRCKANSPGRTMFYTAEMSQRGREQIEMESDLRHALTLGQFFVQYQPKVCLQTGVVVGAEALLRWQHPQHGLVSPATFIPLLEETGLIVSVGEWVLNAVCQQIRTWSAEGKAPLPIAVNCSVRQLQGDLILRQVFAALNDSGVDPSLLELEITESMMLSDPEHVYGLIVELGELGVNTSIDDFGTGYSSLASLKRLPVTILKLDRAFVKDLPDDPDDAAITRAVISMAKALHLQVVAEGVETQEQADFLKALGCEAYQGWLFSPAVPPKRFAHFLADAQSVGLPHSSP